MSSINLYSKEQTDTLLSAKANTTDLPQSSQLVPDTTGASNGDVLTFNGTSTEWAPGGSGGGMTAHTYSTAAAMIADVEAHPNCFIFVNITEAQLTNGGLSRMLVTAWKIYSPLSIKTLDMSGVYYYSPSTWGYFINIAVNNTGSITAFRNAQSNAANFTTLPTIADFTVYY